MSDLFTRRIGTGSLLDLRENPLVAWAVRRARRDPRTIGIAIIYFLFVHGATGILLTLLAAPGFGMRFDEFAAITHVLSWGANAFLFLVWVPTKYAQHLGTEREKKTLDFLRMTRVPSRKICVGAFAAAYLVPVIAALTSIPEILVGCFARKADYLPGVLQAYLALGASSLVATSLAGLIAFLPKKGIQAASTAFFAVVILSIAGGFYATPFFEPLGCLAPWGGIMSGLSRGDREGFVVTLFGATLPGVILQLPVGVALALILLDATTRKIEEEGPGVLGFANALRLAILVALVCAVTISNEPAYRSYYWYAPSAEWGPMVAGRFIVLFLATLPLVADGAVHREEVVRGLARAPEPPRPDERLAPSRPILAIVGVAALETALLLVPVPAKERIAVAVAGAVLASALVVAHLVLQATRLYFSLQARNVMGAVVLGGLWFVPLLGSWGSNVFQLPSWVVSMPSMLCPFVALTKASIARQTSFVATSEVDPIAVALVAVLLNILLASGAASLLRELVARLREFAATLAVLPADVFAPAGKLDRRCSNGHVFASTWDSCPHCPRPGRAEG